MTRRRETRPRLQIDWYRLKSQFVEGNDGGSGERLWPSLEDLSAAHGVPYATIKQRSFDGRWADAREEFRSELDTERRRRIMESRASQITDIDRRALTGVQGGIALIGIRINMLVARENDTPEAERGQKISARELTEIGLAAKRFMEVKALITGQPAAGAEETLEEAERAARVMELAMAERLAEHTARRAEPLPDDQETTDV